MASIKIATLQAADYISSSDSDETVKELSERELNITNVAGGRSSTCHCAKCAAA